MKYLAIYLDCGEDRPTKIRFTSEDNRVYTRLYLIKYEGVDEDAKWSDLEDELDYLKEEVANELDEENLDNITDEKIEEYCKNYIGSDEDVLLALINLKTGEDIGNYFD